MSPLAAVPSPLPGGPYPEVPIIPGTHRNVHEAALIIAIAFADLDASVWLVDDAGERERTLYNYMSIWVGHAVEFGELWLTENKEAVAVWFRNDAAGLPMPQDYHERLALACGRYADRFNQLDNILEAHHPRRWPHQHLAFLAVRPGAQGYGMGSTLLTHQLQQLDTAQIPSYVEASSARSRSLYLRHGYADVRDPFFVGDTDGPPFYPMWRAPKANRNWWDDAESRAAPDIGGGGTGPRVLAHVDMRRRVDGLAYWIA